MHEDSLQRFTPEALEVLRHHNLLRSLIRASIIETIVSPIEIPIEECNEVWENYLSKNDLKDNLELLSHLNKAALNESALHWQLELPLRITKYSEDNFKHKAEARFLAKKESLDRVVYSLIRVKDGFLARELYLRIAGNEDNFADVAAEHSQGPEAKTKGIVGPVPMNQAHPALAERLRTSRPGQLQEPFAIGEWWLIARLERFEGARFESSTAQAISVELFQEWVEEQVVCKIQELEVVA